MSEPVSLPSKVTVSPVRESDADEVLALLCGTDHFQNYSKERFLHNFKNPEFLRHQKNGIQACGFLLRNGHNAIGFTESICREIYLGQRLLLACVGGTLYLKEGEGDSLPTLIYALIDQPAYDLNVTNTANKKSFEINRILRSVPGPESCTQSRYRIFSTYRFLNFAFDKITVCQKVPRPLRSLFSTVLSPFFSFFPPFYSTPLPREKTSLTPKQILQILPEIFDPFWESLLAQNKGLMTSRRTDILQWIFGKGLQSGRYIMLGRFDSDGKLYGEITLELRLNDAGSLFRIVDWAAVGKENEILSDLLRDAVLYVKKNRGFLLEAVGFEEGVQQLISRYLPYARQLSHRSNTFFIRFKEKELKKKTRQNADLGWFYGPFDGDSCWV